MQGWISLHRKILENPIVCKDSDYFSVWCYLLLNATHDKYDVEFKGKRITLNPGQLITGRKAIANQFKIDESKIQRILKKLEIEQQIEQQTSNKNRLITVLRWNEYQKANNKTTSSEQQVNTNNNDNNEIINNIWSAYPNKKGKRDSVERYIPKILKTYTEAQILNAIKVYDKSVKDKQYLLHGSTFFNGRYLDYIDQEPIKKDFDPSTVRIRG